MKLFTLVRNVAFGQWANCIAFIHIGGACLVIGSPFGCSNGRQWYGTGVEICTESRWLRFRRGGYADERRARQRQRRAA